MKRNVGFSLIELMIVVAIIGVLSAIAIPNYMRFQRKARQVEAKSTLGAIYTGEKAYVAEFTGYSDNLVAIGYSPDGTIQYNCGFNSAGNVYGVLDSSMGNYQAELPQSLNVCGDANFAPDCQPSPAFVPPAALAGATVIGAAAFTALCEGEIGGSQRDDWTVDQLKQYVNTASGL